MIAVQGRLDWPTTLPCASNGRMLCDCWDGSWKDANGWHLGRAPCLPSCSTAPKSRGKSFCRHCRSGIQRLYLPETLGDATSVCLLPTADKADHDHDHWHIGELANRGIERETYGLKDARRVPPWARGHLRARLACSVSARPASSSPLTGLLRSQNHRPTDRARAFMQPSDLRRRELLWGLHDTATHPDLVDWEESAARATRNLRLL